MDKDSCMQLNERFRRLCQFTHNGIHATTEAFIGTIQHTQLDGKVACHAAAKGTPFPNCRLPGSWIQSAGTYECLSNNNTKWICAGGQICIQGEPFCFTGTKISNYPTDCATAYSASQ